MPWWRNHCRYHIILYSYSFLILLFTTQKRVGTSKIPKYKSTTTINAIEDIKNEMLPEDTYVSMAERIKLFEKGLGNGSNKPPVKNKKLFFSFLIIIPLGASSYDNKPQSQES